MQKIKVFIVDDHPIMRDALTVSIENEDDMEVIGYANDGAEALALIPEANPDVILMDIMMPNMDGVEALRKLTSEENRAKVLVISSVEHENRVIAAVEAGALGYFPKTAPKQYLIEGIRKVHDGIPYMPSGITLKLFKGIREGKHAQFSNPQITITARQREIILMMADGMTDAEIAQNLHLQEGTVRAHIYQVQQRLGVDTRMQLAVYVNKHLK